MNRRVLSLVAVGGLALLLPGLALATPGEPTYGLAAVDGFYGEWSLAGDFFADMWRAGDLEKPHESSAYLRYDCVTQTMYVLVLTDDGIVGRRDLVATTAWVAIGSQNNKVVNEVAGNDGVPPDFAWVDPGFDGDPYHNRGYEASFHIEPGIYDIIIHLDVIDSGTQTSATTDFPQHGPQLSIECSASPVENCSWSVVKSMYR